MGKARQCSVLSGTLCCGCVRFGEGAFRPQITVVCGIVGSGKVWLGFLSCGKGLSQAQNKVRCGWVLLGSQRFGWIM